MDHFDTAQEYETFVIELYEKYATAVGETTAYDIATEAIATVAPDATNYEERVEDGVCPTSVLEFSQSPLTAGVAQSVDGLAAHLVENDLKLLEVADDPVEYPPTIHTDVELLERDATVYAPAIDTYLRVENTDLIPDDLEAGETFLLVGDYENGNIIPTKTADTATASSSEKSSLLFLPEDVARDLGDEWEPFEGLPDYSAEFEHSEEDFALSIKTQREGDFELALHHPDADGIGHDGWRVERYVAGATGTGLEDARNALNALVTNRDILLENRLNE